MSIFDSSDSKKGSLPLPPLLLLLLQLPRGVGEEHHILFALDLPLEELHGSAVEAHQVLKCKEKVKVCDENEAL